MSEEGSGPERREPLADLTARIDEREDATETGTERDLFAEVQFDELGHGDVWEAIEADETPGGGYVADATDTAVVAKREFCERCQHFAEPPDAHCTHDGTEINVFVDRAHVEVANCPIVEEREHSANPGSD